MFRTAFALLTLLVMTAILGGLVVLATLFRIPTGPGSLFDAFPRIWCATVLSAAGAKLRIHNPERIAAEGSRVYVCNHVSWFDVFALARILPHYRFVAKQELFRIPLFGRAAKATVAIFVTRENRQQAFEAYKEAAASVRQGVSVVVYPEGTRGFTYALRPFKKGPFVLAIAAQAPLVPVVVHGTMEIHGKHSKLIRSGTIDVVLCEPIDTKGLTYDDRDRLMQLTWDRMADALETFGVDSRAGGHSALGTRETTVGDQHVEG
jgi:1-acyl-sn-glycerol-3-phosphate acyltransferase